MSDVDLTVVRAPLPANAAKQRPGGRGGGKVSQFLPAVEALKAAPDVWHRVARWEDGAGDTTLPTGIRTGQRGFGPPGTFEATYVDDRPRVFEVWARYIGPAVASKPTDDAAAVNDARLEHLEDLRITAAEASQRFAQTMRELNNNPPEPVSAGDAARFADGGVVWPLPAAVEEAVMAEPVAEAAATVTEPQPTTVGADGPAPTYEGTQLPTTSGATPLERLGDPAPQGVRALIPTAPTPTRDRGTPTGRAARKVPASATRSTALPPPQSAVRLPPLAADADLTLLCSRVGGCGHAGSQHVAGGPVPVPLDGPHCRRQGCRCPYFGVKVQR